MWAGGARARHERTIEWDEREIRVLDELHLPERTRITSSLPLASPVAADVQPVGELSLRSESRLVAERLFQARSATALVLEGTGSGRVALGWRIALGD